MKSICQDMSQRTFKEAMSIIYTIIYIYIYVITKPSTRFFRLSSAKTKEGCSASCGSRLLKPCHGHLDIHFCLEVKKKSPVVLPEVLQNEIHGHQPRPLLV